MRFSGLKRLWKKPGLETEGSIAFPDKEKG